MLSKKYRFHSRGGVRHTYAHGRTIRSPKLSLVYNNNVRGYTRFAVVVSKKIEKTAVGRNRIRRRVYEAIRLVLADSSTNPTGSRYLKRDYIVVAYNKDIMTMDFVKLKELISSLLEQSML